MSWTIAEREEFDALVARVDELENDTGYVADDNDIDDATVKNWVKTQIALSGGAYVTESEPEPEGTTNG